MSDDWNIKGKIHILYTRNREDNMTFINYELETLHQKLMEDIDTIDCTKNSKLEKWEIIEEVLEIIDKRFGVKK